MTNRRERAQRPPCKTCQPSKVDGGFCGGVGAARVFGFAAFPGCGKAGGGAVGWWAMFDVLTRESGGESDIAE